MFQIILKQALKAIFANKVRSLLTTSGIVIGISSVIIMITAGDGVKKLIENQIQGMGSNIVRVTPGARSSTGIPIGFPPTLKFKDFDNLKKTLANIEYAAPQIFDQKIISYKKEGRSFVVLGSNSNIFKILKAKFESGRPYNEAEVNSNAKVAVIGLNIKNKLFNKEEAIGKKIKIDTTTLTVIGVTKPQGGFLGTMLDSAVIMPFSTSKQILGNRDWLNAIIFEAKTKEDIPSIKKEITNILRKNHKLQPNDKNDFYITTQQDGIQMVDTIFSIITLFVSAIAGISLIVGGIGIMNIMYVTVTERTREIGLRKALGAQNQVILWQFLLESIILTTLGSLIGLGIAYSLTFLVNFIFKLQINISMFSICLSIGVSTTFGITFGYLPARQAALKNPITALRYE